LNKCPRSIDCDGPEDFTTATKDEMMEYLDLMLRMRRMEIAFDNEYKARNIRGFCHLYDGQEACAVGVEAALTREVKSTTPCFDCCHAHLGLATRILGSLHTDAMQRCLLVEVGNPLCSLCFTAI
jgi:pyruvate dehydrogenase E1 component alpha subunit